MLYRESQSLMDYLVEIMPELRELKHRGLGKSPINNAAKKLFALWKDEKNKAGSKVLAKPHTFSMADVDDMQNAGLVELEDNKLRVTAKGVDIIKTMILGDEKSAFDDRGEILDYNIALANTKPKRKMKKVASRDIKNTNWYQRVKE